MLQRLQPLFAPGSVAIVGASGTPGKYGNTVLRYLKAGGFAGPIYPINPEGGHHEGLPFYRSLADVPGRIDCAYSIVPAAATPKVARDAAAADVRALILGASGFAEMGTDDGRARQRDIADVARAAGMVLLGPNTNGIWNAHHGLALGFNASHGERMTPGAISVAAHSGALFDSFLPRLTAMGGGIAKLVPLGNEATLDMQDVIEALIDDPETRVIGLIMEAIGEGARLRVLARKARAAGKPIFALKLARSAAGQTAAIAHSSRLAGSARAYDALFRAAGIVTVRSIETLAATCTIACQPGALSMSGDTRLLGVSGSGGGCSIIADHAADRGISLAGDIEGRGIWTGETARVIKGFTDAGHIRNPIDGGNLHGYDKLPAILDATLRDGVTGPLVYFAHRLPTAKGDLAYLDPILARKTRCVAPVVVLSPGGLRPETAARCREHGLPVFSDAATCFDALRAICDVNDRPDAAANEPPHEPSDTKASEIARRIDASKNPHLLDEIEAAALLRLVGVPMIESRAVATVQDAHAAAGAIGYPVVMKAIVPGVAHKNDAGHVMLGLADAAAVGAAYARLSRDVAEHGGTVIVQPHARGRHELLLGVTHEPGLGHFLLIGLGGVQAEILDETHLFPIPMGRSQLLDALAATRLARLLRPSGEGYAPLGDIADAMLALQSLALAAPRRIQSIDVNPLLVCADRVVAVDALIVPRRALDRPAGS